MNPDGSITTRSVPGWVAEWEHAGVTSSTQLAPRWICSDPRDPMLTDPEFDLADKIEAVLEARPGEWLIPSRIARLVHEPLGHVRPVLEWMCFHQIGARHDGGSYGIRRFSTR
jgi:hypothetical protein